MPMSLRALLESVGYQWTAALNTICALQADLLPDRFTSEQRAPICRRLARILEAISDLNRSLTTLATADSNLGDLTHMPSAHFGPELNPTELQCFAETTESPVIPAQPVDTF